MEFRRVLFRSDQHVRHQHRARHHWADVVRRSQPAGALTLSQVERKTMTVLLYLFVAVLLATGLSLLWLGATLLMLGGSPYYVLAGVAITLSAILIARRHWSGVWVYSASSEEQTLMRISYAVFCLKKKKRS